MKRLFVIALAALIVPSSIGMTADAKKKPKRTQRVIEATYANPAIGVPGVVGASNAGGAVEFALGSKEAFIAVEITDDGGQPVTATLSQNSDETTPQWEIFATICGKTDQALEVLPGVPVRVSVYTTPGPEQPNCTGPASSGTIKATLSNLP